MLRVIGGVVGIVVLLGAPATGANPQYTIKQANTPPPKELQESIRKLLDENALQLSDDKGALLCEVWFRKELPVKATPEQIKNGLTYRELEETTLMGAVRFAQLATDYRKQKIKPDVYTLRLGFQPMDGDHMGTAPYGEFCLLVAAKADEKPDIMDAKELRALSAKALGGSHPGVLLLFPNEKPEETPKLVDKGNKTWVLTLKEPVVVDGQKAQGALGIGLTLIGHSSAE
jgi:hypothetical protein